jgi:hypothetical protein
MIFSPRNDSEEFRIQPRPPANIFPDMLMQQLNTLYPQQEQGPQQ